MTDKELKEKSILDKAECIQELRQINQIYVGQEVSINLSGVNGRYALRFCDGIGSVTHDMGHAIFSIALRKALEDYKQKLQEFIDKG